MTAALTTIILRHIDSQGYHVQAEVGDRVICVVIDQHTGEQSIATADDAHLAACELAELVGVDLAHG